MDLATKLATTSGLTWATIRRHAKSDLLERSDEGEPIYLHARNCPSFCDFACNGRKGDQVASDVSTLENYIPDDDSDL